MGKRAWLLIAVMVLLVLPVAAASIGVVLLDPNDYKSAITGAVQNATGRTLTINGPVRLRGSLWPTIEVSDVTLANLPGGSRPDLARAERIEAQLSLPGLLWRRIEVVKLTLVGPNILFEQVGGAPNWVFNPPRDARGVPAGTSGGSFDLRIRHVVVQNGMVTWRLPARTKIVGIRALDLQHHTDGGRLAVDAVLVYADNRSFRLSASARPTAGLADPWATKLAFSAFDTVASATGTMDVAGHYDLQAEARVGALDKLNALLPEMRLPAAHRLTLSTHLTNGPVPGDLPVVGATQLHIGDADLGDRIAGLKLGATDVSLPEAGGLATLSGAGRWAGQAFTLSGAFRVPVHPDGRENLDLDLEAQTAPGIEQAVSGSVGLKGRLVLDALRFGGLDAAVTLRTSALAAVGPLLVRWLPALTDVRFDGRLSVPADLGSVQFRAARLLTQQGDVGGDGTIGLSGGVAVNARLRSGKLDLNAVLTAFGIDLTAASGSISPTGPMIAATPLPWSILRGPAIDVSGSIDEIRFRDQVWGKADLALQLKDGRVQVGNLNVALPGGPLAMSMTADATADPVAVSVVAHTAAVPLAFVARYASLPGPVSGTVGIDARLQAKGQSAHDLVASLDGTISVSAVGGELTNAAFRQLTGASLGALGIQVPLEGETKLGCLGIAGLFAKGVGRFQTIVLETSHLSLSGVGQVDLGQETVALRLNPLVRISGAPVSVPVVVEGPFRGIAGRLNANGLDKLGLLVDAWLGGDHPEACADAGLVATPTGGR